MVALPETGSRSWSLRRKRRSISSYRTLLGLFVALPNHWEPTLAHKAKRTRNYAKEYQARVTRGLARGKSRAQARGHARAGDVAGKTGQTRFDKSSALDQALKL